MVHRHHHHESTIPGEIPVPHGPPDSDSEHISDEPIAYATADERRIFSHVTRPDDSYTEDGVYWADLPLAQRYRFVSKVDNDAAKEEAKTAWSMFKEDPLSPFSWYFRHAVIPGAGLGLEGYVLFSIGNLEPLFKAVWPDCWGKEPTTCSHNWIASVTYLEIIGIMVGQAVVGVSSFCPFYYCIWWIVLTARRLWEIGSVADGASFRMLPSCLSVCSCSLPHGALPFKAGLSVMPGLSSFTVSVLVASTPLQQLLLLKVFLLVEGSRLVKIVCIVVAVSPRLSSCRAGASS